jgi:micrococcal nuclease
VAKPGESPTFKISAVSGVVARVIDGDTIEVRLGERLLKVRLIGMDTPESVHPTVKDECFGAAAARYTRELLEGKQVNLTFDVERRDLYGRTLAYVWTDDGLFNVEIVRAGYAHSYTVPPNVRYAEAILRAQRTARRERYGLWNQCPEGGKAAAAIASDSRPKPNRSCTRDYRPCLPPAPDYDCFGGEGDGPKYVKKSVRVFGNDPYQLDHDGDGRACGGGQ